MLRKKQLSDIDKEIAALNEKKPLLDFINEALSVIYDVQNVLTEEPSMSMINEFIAEFEREE